MSDSRAVGFSKAELKAANNHLNGRESFGNYRFHVCYLCGQRFDCEEKPCQRAVLVRVGPCCDIGVTERRKEKKHAKSRLTIPIRFTDDWE